MLVAGVVAVVAFSLSYIRPGRFGATALALGAGYILATLWADSVAAYAYNAGVQLTLPLKEVFYSGLVVLPGLMVLLFSPKRSGLMPRLVAAIAAAGLTVALLLPVLAAGSENEAILSMISRHQESIIAAGLLLGLFDMVISRTPKPLKRGKD